MSIKTNKLNICLIRSEHTNIDEIIKPGAKVHSIEGVGSFHTDDSHTNRPGWLKDFFVGKLDELASIFTASARGVLLVEVDWIKSTRIFAILFGYGRHLLNNSIIEEDFGLRVVLNCVDRNSLRSIDKTTLGSTPKLSREQMSRESEVANFGIDIEQDLVNAVTGRSNDKRFGRTISGRDALAMSVKVDLTNIRDFLPACLEKRESNEYKENFEWIDQIKSVRDQKLLAELNDRLVSKLKEEQFDRIWMAPPAILDWVDVSGFRYAKGKSGKLYYDLSTRDFLATLGQETVSLDVLKKRAVYAISAKTDKASDEWSIFECFYAEQDMDGDVFVLNNGKWYRISTGFSQQVLADFGDMPDSSIKLPNYAHTNEAAYNDALPSIVSNSCCMDRKLINYGGGHNAIEFCDLLTADNQIIHVKRYGGSAQFSHLFNQGVVSGELFVQERDFRQLVNEKLPDTHKLANVTQRPNAAEYEVVFAIISKSKRPLDIPFFSKVGLRNARRRLEAYGYTVTKKKIEYVMG